jgi:maltose-binding protein MalE/serine/threonine protein kinase
VGIEANVAIIASTTILNGKYKIAREIGQGGMGRVWLAEELVFGSRLVALKEPRTDLPASELEELDRRYTMEVQINLALQKVQTPNIVQVYTVEPFENSSLLSMAYMPNGDLVRLLGQSGGRLSLEQSLAIGHAVLQALRSAHEHPLEIVHRDIKPSNILFDADHKPYLADFGLAQLSGASARSQVQGVRMHPGTPAYMAPEQASSIAYLTPAADIYAVGCVLFEMLTGTKYKRVRPGTKPSSVRPDIPASIDALVAKATAEDPFDRFGDAGDMLNAVAAGMTAISAAQTSQPPSQSQPLPAATRPAGAERQARVEQDTTIQPASAVTTSRPAGAIPVSVVAPHQPAANQRSRRRWGSLLAVAAAVLVLAAGLIALLQYAPAAFNFGTLAGVATATDVPAANAALATAPPNTATSEATALATPAATAAALPTATPDQPVGQSVAGADAAAGAASQLVGGPPLTIWADEARALKLEKAANGFTEQYGVEVNVVQKGFDDLRTDFLAAAPAGQGPDILLGAHDWIGEFISSGLLAEVSLGDKSANFTPAAVQGFTYTDGKLYGMPQAVENVALYFNTELVSTPPTTWEEVRILSQKLKEKGLKYGFLIQTSDPYHFYPIQTAFGGYVFGKKPDGSYLAENLGINSPGTVAAFEWLDGMYTAGLLDRSNYVDGSSLLSTFQKGDAAMMIGGPWALDDLHSAGVPFAIASIPEGTEPGRPFLGVQGFMINAFSQNQQLAQTFLQEFVATDGVMQDFYNHDPRVSAWIPVAKNIPDSDLRAFYAAGASADPLPNISEMNSVWMSWGDAMTAIAAGKLAPQPALDQAQQQIETAISVQQ